MSKKCDYSTAYFLGKEVDVVNGYKSPRRGFIVEIFSDEDESISRQFVPRQSISVWKLNQKNAEGAELFFQKIFGLSYEAAKNLDKRRGINTKTKLMTEIKDTSSELPIILIPNGEHVPEDVICFAMALAINNGAA